MAKAFVPVTGAGCARRAFEDLQRQWGAGARVYPGRHVGFRGGGYLCTLYWRPELHVWGSFETPGEITNRFWVCWGNEPPDGPFNIVVETNPPFEAYDRRCSGAFLRDDYGAIYLAHSGRVGGGRKGIGKKAFREFAELSDWIDVRWPDGRYSDYLLLGRLGEASLNERIAAFVHEVARFKQWAVSGAETAVLAQP